MVSSLSRFHPVQANYHTTALSCRSYCSTIHRSSKEYEEVVVWTYSDYNISDPMNDEVTV